MLKQASFIAAQEEANMSHPLYESVSREAEQREHQQPKQNADASY